jgi:hypothetical protein
MSSITDSQRVIGFFEKLTHTVSPSAGKSVQEPHQATFKAIQMCEDAAKEVGQKIVGLIKENLKELFDSLQKIYKQENSSIFFAGLPVGLGLEFLTGSSNDSTISTKKFTKSVNVLTTAYKLILTLFDFEDDASCEFISEKHGSSFLSGAVAGVFVASAIKQTRKAAKEALQGQSSSSSAQQAPANPNTDSQKLVNGLESVVKAISPSANQANGIQKDVYDATLKAIDNCKLRAQETSKTIIALLTDKFSKLFISLKDVYATEDAAVFVSGLFAGSSLTALVGSMMSEKKFGKISNVSTAVANLILSLFTDADSVELVSEKRGSTFIAGAKAGVLMTSSMREVKKATKAAWEKNDDVAALQQQVSSSNSSNSQAKIDG